MGKGLRFIAICSGAITLALITSCSGSTKADENQVTNSTNSSPSSSASDGSKSNQALVQPANDCSQSEFDGGSAWIEGQLRAFNNSEAKVAYGFASKNFQSQTSLEQFVAIISTRYPMLLNLKSFSIYSCQKTEGYFLFNVSLNDKANQTYTMQYLLSLVNKKWGVEAAVVTSDQG